MLVEFTVGNYLSFKEPVTLSLVAGKLSEDLGCNVFTARKTDLLKSAVIYGANAGGKSNLITAINFMKDLILTSFRDAELEKGISVEHFRLSTETEKKPSFFEIVFIHEEIKYRYGFEIDREKVHSEWLFRTEKTKEAKMFTRLENEIELNRSFKEGRGFEKKIRKSVLFLSFLIKFEGDVIDKIREWFEKFNILTNLEDYSSYTFNRLSTDVSFKEKILQFLKIADLSIEELAIKEIMLDKEALPAEIKKQLTVIEKKEGKAVNVSVSKLLSKHKKYDNTGNIESLETFNFASSESAGTRKFFSIGGPIIDTLEKGKILIIDELDCQLHPLMLQNIVKLFNSCKNRKNSQLIFTCHNTSLLSGEFFRRDQIWFAEKDEYSSTSLYSLAEYKGIRKEALYGKDYILGKYGAVPYTGNFDFFYEDMSKISQ